MSTQHFVIYEPGKFEELFRGMYNDLHRKAFLMLNDEAQAADIIQDVFLKAIEKEVFNGKVDNVAGYLHRMVRNAAVDALKSNKIVSMDTEATMLYGEPADETINHFDIVEEERKYASYMNQIRSELTKSEFAVFELKKQGLSRNQMAEKLNCSEATVHSHVTNANRKLAKVREMIIEC